MPYNYRFWTRRSFCRAVKALDISFKNWSTGVIPPFYHFKSGSLCHLTNITAEIGTVSKIWSCSSSETPWKIILCTRNSKKLADNTHNFLPCSAGLISWTMILSSGIGCLYTIKRTELSGIMFQEPIEYWSAIDFCKEQQTISNLCSKISKKAYLFY